MMLKMASGECLTRPISDLSDNTRKEEKKILMSSASIGLARSKRHQATQRNLNGQTSGKSEDLLSNGGIKTPIGLENTIATTHSREELHTIDVDRGACLSPTSSIKRQGLKSAVGGSRVSMTGGGNGIKLRVQNMKMKKLK